MQALSRDGVCAEGLDVNNDYDAICQRIHDCRTRKEALRIAAELVLMHCSGAWRASTLQDQFGNALLDIFEEQEKARSDRCEAARGEK